MGFRLSVSLISKVSDSWIRDLKFNHCLHKKLIGFLVEWKKVIIKSECYKLKFSKNKIK